MNDQTPFAELLRSDFPSFYRRAFRELNPNTKLADNWHFEAIVYLLEQIQSGDAKRAIVNMPPRSAKSELCSVIFPGFLLGHDPSCKIICVSYAQALASELSRKFRRIISSDWYQKLFPRFKTDKDAEDHISTTMGGMRFATSIGGVLTGIGGSLIIIDDPMKPDDAPSASERKKVIRYFRETLFSRLDDRETGAILVVMQRLHEDDLAGHLLSEGGGAWTHLNLPAIAKQAEDIPIGQGVFHHREPGDLLHPARLSQASLDEVKRTLGSVMFEAQYQQSPVPEGGNIIKRAWLQQYETPPALDSCRVMQSWDTASKGDLRHDYSVCTTWALRDGNHYLIDVFRKRMEYPELLTTAKLLHDKYRPSGLLIEDQGSGIALIQQLKGEGIPAIGWHSKLDKISRLSAAAPTFQAGQVHLPAEAPWLPDLLHELLGFYGTKHDDQVDSVSQYLGWCRDNGGEDFIYHSPWDGGPAAPETLTDLLANLPRW